MLDRIIRVADILQDVEGFIESISLSEHNSVMALILVDYCNETVLKAVYSHLFNKGIDKKTDMWKCWGDINKELKSENHNVGISELPLKQEILNVVHEKRNFVQHSGESVNPEKMIRYFTSSKAFIEVALKEILGEDINSLSPVRFIKSQAYRLLITKAIEYKDSNALVAGAFVNCALYYANRLHQNQRHAIDGNLGSTISRQFRHQKFNFDILNGVGSRILANTKAIERIIQDGCNPPMDILDKLPSGHLFDDQSFTTTRRHGVEVTSEEIKLAINFAIRFIVKLEKLNMLHEFNLDIEKGIINK